MYIIWLFLCYMYISNELESVHPFEKKTKTSTFLSGCIVYRALSTGDGHFLYHGTAFYSGSSTQDSW